MQQNQKNYLLLIEKAKSPRWVLGPDIVCDRSGTIREFFYWEDKIRAYRHPLAFAVQDGMIHKDVPSGVEVIFVGGSTEWKLRALPS